MYENNLTNLNKSSKPCFLVKHLGIISKYPTYIFTLIIAGLKFAIIFALQNSNISAASYK